METGPHSNLCCSRAVTSMISVLTTARTGTGVIQQANESAVVLLSCAGGGTSGMAAGGGVNWKPSIVLSMAKRRF